MNSADHNRIGQQSGRGEASLVRRYGDIGISAVAGALACKDGAKAPAAPRNERADDQTRDTVEAAA